MPIINAARLRQTVDALNGAALLLVLGDTSVPISGNQRTVATLAHLLKAEKPAGNVGVLITAAGVTTVSGSAVPLTGDASSPVPVTPVDVAAFTAAVQAAQPNLACVKQETTTAIQIGQWAAGLIDALKSSIDAAQDAPAIIARALAINDAEAQTNIAKAGAVCSATFRKYAIEFLQKEVSKSNPMSVAAVAEAFTDVVNHPDKMSSLEQMDTTGFEAAFNANVQAGDSFDYRVANAALSPQPICGPVIGVALGSKCNGYTAYCARSIFVQPVSDQIKAAYTFLLELNDQLLSLLNVGKALKDVHAQAMAWAEQKNAVLAKQLGADLGFATGLHFSDKNGSISARATLPVQVGTVVAFKLVLSDIQAEPTPAPIAIKTEDGAQEAAAAEPSREPRRVSLILGDTVVVNEKGAAFATKAKRAIDDVSFAVKMKAPKAEVDVPPREARFTRGAAAALGLNQENAREEAQRRIFNEKREAWIAAGSPSGVDKTGGRRPEDATASGMLARGALTTYPEGIPAEFNDGKSIFVDRVKQALVLPIGGKSIPFHICTVAKVETRPDAGGKTSITITFATTQQSNVAFGRHKNRQWVKELTYIRADGGPLYKVMAEVKEVQQIIAANDKRNKMSSNLASDERLIAKTGAPRLPTVKIRPMPTAQRGFKGAIVGSVDAHQNGLRFSYGMGNIDIPYSNVKHFICQPARRDVSVILHCALKAPMKLAQGDAKPTDQVQFYCEVVETSEAASNTRKTHDEEVEAEEKDQERVRNTNRQFAQFARKVQEICPQMKVLAPFQELEIDGAGKGKLAKFRGCEEALWSISELPFTVISVEDIEIVSLERVLPNSDTFDAIFIHKDYTTVTEVTTIPMTRLEVLKDWMNQAKLLFFQGTANVRWVKVLKEMRDDPEWQAWGEGGWAAYLGYDDDAEGGEGDDDSDADDSDYESDDDDEEEEDYSESGSDWASEGSSSDPDAGSSDDEGDDGSYADSDDDGGDSDESSDRGKRKRAAAPKKGAAQPARAQPAPRRR